MKSDAGATKEVPRPEGGGAGALEDALVIAIQAYRDNGVKGKTPALLERVLSSFMGSSRVRGIVTYHTHAAGLDSERDEITQELAILLANKFLVQLDRPENIYPLLSDSAQKCCSGLKRRLMSHSGRYSSLDENQENSEHEETSGSILFIRDDGEYANADTSSIDGVEHELSRQSLFAQLRHRVQNDANLSYLNQLVEDMENNAVQFPFADRVDPIERPVIQKKKTGVSDLPQTCARLVEIRGLTGLSVNDFSKVLATPRGAMTSYLYGRVKAVPKELLEAAEALLRERGNLMGPTEAEYEGKEMSEIVLEWAERLRIHHAQIPGQLSPLLNVDNITVKRWLQNKTRPILIDLSNYGKAIYKRFSEKQMSVFVQEWSKKLQIAPGQIPERLSIFLRVNEAIVKLWIGDQARPDLHELIRFDREVMDPSFGKEMPLIVRNWAERLHIAEPQIPSRLASLLKEKESTVMQWLENKSRLPLSTLKQYDGVVQITADSLAVFLNAQRK